MISYVCDFLYFSNTLLKLLSVFWNALCNEYTKLVVTSVENGSNIERFSRFLQSTKRDGEERNVPI